MDSLIDQYLRKPIRYADIDGLNDIGLGIATLGWSLIFLIPEHLPRDSVLARDSWLLMPLVMGPLVLLIHFGTRLARERLTFPRTGYVAYSTSPGKYIAVIAVAVITALAAVFTASQATLSVTFVMGSLVAAASLHRLARTGLLRYGLLAGASVGIGLVLSFQDLGFREGTMWFCLLMGMTLLVSGTVTMWRYLRQTSSQETASR